MELLNPVEKRRPMSYQFQPSTIEMVDQIAEATGQSKAVVADHAIREYFKVWEAEQEESDEQ